MSDKRKYSDDEVKKRREEYEIREKQKRERIKKRRKRARLKRKIFGIFFLLLLILCSLIIIMKTPLFAVKSIEIKGNELVSDEVIANLSGLDIGNSIFNKTSASAQRDILSLPYISEVSVKKSYPSKVIISISELNASYMLKLDTRNVLIDKNGKSIKEAEGEETTVFPIILGLSDGGFKLGSMITALTDEETEIFYRLIQCIKDYGFGNLTEIDLTDEYNISFRLNGTLKVRIGSLGSEDELSYKMAYIKEVLEKLPENVTGVIGATNPSTGVSYRASEASEPETEGKPLSEGGIEEPTQESTEETEGEEQDNL